MRIHFENTTHLARVAKTLRKTLLARDIDVPLGKCHDTVARMSGYANWHEVTQTVGKQGAQISSVPDDLATEAEKAERHGQYLGVLQAGGLPQDLARELLKEISPTLRRVSCPDADASFLLEGTQFEGFDLSPAVIANLPGLLNLLRRVHHAAIHQPFWSERASWDGIETVHEDAVHIANQLRRSVANTWWGSAIALTLSHYEGRYSRLDEEAVAYDLSTALLVGGPGALSVALAGLSKREMQTVVANVSAQVGARVIQKSAEKGLIPGDYSDAYFHHNWGDEPWRVPKPFSIGDLGPDVWEPVFAPRPHQHGRVPEWQNVVEIKAVSSLDDEDARFLLANAKGAPSTAATLEFLGAGDARFIMLRQDDEDDWMPIAGCMVRRTFDKYYEGITIECLGTWGVEEANRVAHDGFHVPSFAEGVLVNAIGRMLDAEVRELEKVRKPGSKLPIRVIEDRSSVGIKIAPLIRASIDAGYFELERHLVPGRPLPSFDIVDLKQAVSELKAEPIPVWDAMINLSEHAEACAGFAPFVGFWDTPSGPVIDFDGKERRAADLITPAASRHWNVGAKILSAAIAQLMTFVSVPDPVLIVIMNTTTAYRQSLMMARQDYVALKAGKCQPFKVTLLLDDDEDDPNALMLDLISIFPNLMGADTHA